MNFDYIIIGGGSAGCILANKLSESGKFSVVLLESGGSDNSMWYKIPVGFAKSYYNEKSNWMFYSQPEAELNNRNIYCPRGMVLGGSGSINAMIFIRGLKHDFDDWAKQGNSQWSFDKVLPIFKELETHPFGDGPYHGGSGPIKITRMKDVAHPLCNYYLSACKELGYNVTDDFNGENPYGAGIYDINVNNGVRSSSSFEYLTPALKRKNLTVMLNSRVEKILFSGKKAIGVKLNQGNNSIEIKSNKEVILSAGAVHSPIILQLSGVGPSDLLAKHNIKLVHELDAVGKNLQDHICASYYYEAKIKTLNDEIGSLYGKAKTALNYALFKKGLFAISVNQAGGLFKGDENLIEPNIQLYFNPLSYQIPKDGSRTLKPEPYSGFLLAFNPCRPTSRGFIEIASNNYMDAPLIKPMYLTTEHDKSEVIQGTRLVQKIMNSKSLRDVTVRQTVPSNELKTESEMLDYFRENSGSIYHLCGSCAMGDNPKITVVDQNLKVHGLENLRVVDASVFPNVPSGNTNAAAMMVGLKGALLILQDGVK